MVVKGLNHLLFSVSDLERSIHFYKEVFEAKLLVKGRTTAYFDLNGMWLALKNKSEMRPLNAVWTGALLTEIKETRSALAFRC